MIRRIAYCSTLGLLAVFLNTTWAVTDWLTMLQCSRELGKITSGQTRSGSMHVSDEVALTSLDKMVGGTRRSFLIVYSETHFQAFELPARATSPRFHFRMTNADPRMPPVDYYVHYVHGLLFGSYATAFSAHNPPEGQKRLSYQTLRKVSLPSREAKAVFIDGIKEKMEVISRKLDDGPLDRRDLLLGNLSICRQVSSTSKVETASIRRSVDELMLLSPRTLSGDRFPASYD